MESHSKLDGVMVQTRHQQAQLLNTLTLTLGWLMSMTKKKTK
jgi:hypothetical protein